MFAVSVGVDESVGGCVAFGGLVTRHSGVFVDVVLEGGTRSLLSLISSCRLVPTTAPTTMAIATITTTAIKMARFREKLCCRLWFFFWNPARLRDSPVPVALVAGC